MKSFLLSLVVASCFTPMAFSANPASVDVSKDPSFFNPIPKYTQGTGLWEKPYQQRKVMKGRYIVIDTRNQEKCHEIALKYVSNNKEFCRLDEKKPIHVAYVVNTNEFGETDFQSSIPMSEVMKTDDSLYSHSRNIFVGSIGMVGLIYLLPESVSNWNKEDFKNGEFVRRWEDNVKSGPVVDKDDFFINYVGHPVSGANYYMMARMADHGPWESFAYSAFISTFFWEYGVESFAETPSIQDLISTPVVGALMGEVFYHWTLAIKANGEQIWGSRRLGRTAMILMNPIGEFSYWMNDRIENSFLSRLFSRSEIGFFQRRINRDQADNSLENTAFGLQMTIYFKK